MSDEDTDFVELIDNLDHPSVPKQNQILARLSESVDEARPVVLANLPMVSARTRRALLRWLDDHDSPDVTLPLMRYVFDERGNIAEGTGRSMAMALLFRRARKTTIPEERGRLRAFAEDICDAEAPDVRRLALRILGDTGDRDSMDVVQRRLDDDIEEVRDAARRTLDALKAVKSRGGADDELPPDELLRRLVESAGPRRRQLIRRWRDHPAKSDIAVGMLERGTDLQQQALRILIDEPVEEARPLLAPMILRDPDDSPVSLALRLLTKFGDKQGATDDEEAGIRRALGSSDALTRAAACRAAAAFGLRDLADRVIALARGRDLVVALEAAESLTELLESSDDGQVRQLMDAIEAIDRRRQSPLDRDMVELLAHLLSALRIVVSPETIGIRRLHRRLFDILAARGGQRPIRVTVLQVLLASTPTDGLEKHDRWDVTSASVLVDLIADADGPTAQRIALLLRRGAPAKMPGLDRVTRDLWKSGSINVADVVVPLLDRARTDLADEWLKQLADGEEPAATEARRVLRRRRGEDVIDVEFIPRDDNR